MSQFAIITGASSGIGLELARIAAEEGYDLLLVADTPFNEAVAGSGAVETAQIDLSTVEGVDELLAMAEGRTIDVLCANAGTGHGGSFLDQDPPTWRRTIDTNILGNVYLLHRVLTEMSARNDGKILVTGSIAGYIPGSFNAIYNATKAFIDNFTEAVRNEIKDKDGVTLTTLMPGATDTEFFARADMLDSAVGKSDKKDDPAKVARDGWDAMMDGKGVIVSGLHNKLQVAAAGVVPGVVLAAAHRKMAQTDRDKAEEEAGTEG